MKIETTKAVITLLSINTVFANTLPPTFDYIAGKEFCAPKTVLKANNSLPPTPDYCDSPVKVAHNSVMIARGMNDRVNG